MKKLISEHISNAEATKSATATKAGIDNTPSAVQLLNMRRIATQIFEPLRNSFGVPLGISSFFRSKELNKVLGGSPTSQHCCNGESAAMDIDADIYGYAANSAVFHYIAKNCDFDQLIWEYGDDYEPAWVHVSQKLDGNRGEILKAKRVRGRTVYEKMEVL